MSLTAAPTHRHRPLCFVCFRKGRDVPQSLAAPRPAILRSPFGFALTEQQIAHRRRMLEFALTQQSHAPHR